MLKSFSKERGGFCYLKPGHFRQAFCLIVIRGTLMRKKGIKHMGEVEQLVRRAKKRDPDAFTELMQLIDLEHKNLYIYQRIQREIERGERAGWPQRYDIQR